MNRLWRVWLLMLVAIVALSAQITTAHATTATANLTAGQLTISPASVTISYNVIRESRGKALTSSFSVIVTDATGAKAGWQILAATADTVSPQADFPIDDHAIVDFSVPEAEGTWPDPTCPCGVVPTAFSTILQTPAKTGMGWSKVEFQTEFDVPADAAPGQYTVTLALVIVPPGMIAPMPPKLRSNPTAAPGAAAPNPIPHGRPMNTAGANPAVSGIPAPMPTARPIIPPTTTAPNTNAVTSMNAAQATQVATAESTGAPSITAVPTTNATNAPGATAGAPSANAGALSAPTNSTATATPVASAVTPFTATNQQQSARSATSAPAVSNLQGSSQPAGVTGGGVNRSVLPVVASAPAVTRSDATVTVHSSFVVDTQDHAANWNLQATLGTSDPTADLLGDAIAMSLDMLDGDSAALVSAQAWTLPYATGPGALVNVTVPQGIGQVTLLLNTQMHAIGEDMAHLAGAILAITIITGP